jgi:guanylate kinase
VHYHFLTPDAFREYIKDGRFVEYEEVYPGLLYGTLVSEVDAATNERPVLLDIDVRGALRVKQIFGSDALAIFIAPPSFEELEQRLTGRGTETSEGVLTRLDRARTEMTFADSFDGVVVNDDLEIATDEAISHVARFLQGLPLVSRRPS